MKRGVWPVLLITCALSLGVTACSDGATTATTSRAAGTGLDGVSFTVHQAPGCGCCEYWVGYLQERGASVDLTEDRKLAELKSSHGVPEDAVSCHTALVDGYVVEGHVPAGAIIRLLDDRPDAIGLALPGMPLDSPGMGGDVATWEAQPVMLIQDDGELVPFDY